MSEYIFIKLYFITLPILLLMDALWLGILAKNFYQQQIGFLMVKNINWSAALLFYIVFAAGLVFFVIIPGLEKGNWLYIFLTGAFLGFLAYAAYDLTNLATIKNWPLTVTIIDLIWGSLLSALVSLIVFLIVKRGL